MKILSYLFFFLAPSVIFVSAQADVTGVVVKSVNMPNFPKGQKIHDTTIIKTLSGQKVAIKTSQNDMVVIDENSFIVIKKPSFLKHLFGRIYYHFKKRTKRSINVETTTATIGVRGTNFLINSKNDPDNSHDVIALDKGLLDIDSNDEVPFKVHKPKDLNEFEQFAYDAQQGMQEINAEFETYKKHTDLEFLEYKLSLKLNPGHMVSIQGKDLVTEKISNTQQNNINSFKAFIADVDE